MKFEELNIITPIMKALKAEGYEAPTPIQERAIPAVLKGRDLLGCAQTGTGKTAAFSIPLLQILSRERINERAPRTIRALILAPTRELALQTGENLRAYGKYLGIKHTVIFGGYRRMPRQGR